jgi:hypothetical protein
VKQANNCARSAGAAGVFSQGNKNPVNLRVIEPIYLEERPPAVNQPGIKHACRLTKGIQAGEVFALCHREQKAVSGTDPDDNLREMVEIIPGRQAGNTIVSVCLCHV